MLLDLHTRKKYMKLRNKLILDLCLFITIWLVMSYHFTGGLLHEILGLSLIIGFIVHIILNRKYYFSMTKKLLDYKEADKKRILSFIINIIMFLLLIVMLISSLAISKDILPGISQAIGNFGMWKTIHILAAVMMLICITAHVLLHAPLFTALFNKYNKNVSAARLMRVIGMLMALSLIAATVKVSINSIGSIARHGMKKRPENYIQIEKREQDTPDVSGTIEEDTPDVTETIEKDTPDVSETIEKDTTSTSGVSLEEYLQGLFCNGCGRHCSLLSPQCGKGYKKAEQAKEEYYSVSENSSR